jgi:AcrR family transcriptional regulator
MSAEQTRTRILDAAFREFAEHGLAGARVDRIAKSAGCNKNLIYVYFQSKEALYATVLDRSMTSVFESFPFTAQDLPAVARHVFDQARVNPGVFRLLAWATLEHSAAAMPPTRKDEYDRTLALIREQQESGAIRNDAPPELILMSVLTLATAWLPVFPFGEAATPGTGLSPDTVRDWIADMVGRIAGQKLVVDAARGSFPGVARVAEDRRDGPGSCLGWCGLTHAASQGSVVGVSPYVVSDMPATCAGS